VGGDGVGGGVGSPAQWIAPVLVLVLKVTTVSPFAFLKVRV
jgi:hypothetical protein